jgi:hypothetical protein
MYRNDLILNETRKLALILAKLLGLKTEGNTKEFIQLADDTLMNEFNLRLDELLNLTLNDFELRLSTENYCANKLDALAQLLYLRNEPFNTSAETLLALHKILIIFDLLEQKHHRQSFENISKRNLIYQFIKNNYE